VLKRRMIAGRELIQLIDVNCSTMRAAQQPPHENHNRPNDSKRCSKTTTIPASLPVFHETRGLINYPMSSNQLTVK
jgi:hypothetical protein